MGYRGTPNVATIPFGVPFLPSLVGALVDGQLIDGFAVDRDPLALADVTIYLPTRRAVRQIRSVIAAGAKGSAVLPRIVALADLDSEPEWDGETEDNGLAGIPLVSQTERQLILTGHILEWAEVLNEAFPDYIQESSAVPGSPADAALMARSLAQLIDQVRSEGGDWSKLDGIAPDDLASHFAIIRAFLNVARETWPEHLGSHGSLDPGVQRDAIIRREAERLRKNGSKGPVIAAGSTGSVPATAELLSAISRLPNGSVVLPGLDMVLDEQTWASIGDRSPDASHQPSPSHPQYGLKSLLDMLEVARADVRIIVEPDENRAWRAMMVSEAMRPADTVDAWASESLEREQPAEHDKAVRAIEDLSLIDAANEREEALAIALILRRNLETVGRTAALITPDRALARRVSVELARWGISVDDSAGLPLLSAAPGTAALLAAQVVLSGFQADTLLAWLKHPLVAVSGSGEQTTLDARLLERAILRGPALPGGLEAIERAFIETFDLWQRYENGEIGVHLPQAARALTHDDWDRLGLLLRALADVTAPFNELLERPDSPSLKSWLEAHGALLDATLSLSDPFESSDEQAAQRLRQRMAEIRAMPVSEGLLIDRLDFPDLFKALLGDIVVRQTEVETRIQILGVLEARLQTFDEVVLAGLNEGTWPAITRSDAFLSRTMSAEIGLEPPERRIGLAAHDFSQALGQAKVWLTRSDRVDGQPQVASRWVQRLLTYIGPDLAQAMRQRGAAMLQIARTLDDLDTDNNGRDGSWLARRPAPNPPVRLRPRRLSVTEIETLIRDPYAIYARHVLKMRAFEPIASEPGPLERGNILHEIFERFVRACPMGPYDEAAHSRLTLIGREVFSEYRAHAIVHALWWPRFLQVADWFVATEASLDNVLDRKVECRGVWRLSNQFSLVGRADRIDVLADGTHRVADYKTGQPPSGAQVLHLSPQLILEALMVEAGAFSEASGDVSALDYYKLSGTCGLEGRGFQKESKSRPEVTLKKAMALTRQRLDRLISYYQAPQAVYRSQAIPESGRSFVGDYDHLARVAEWSVEDDVL